MELEKLGLGAMTHPETQRWIARVVLCAHIERMMVADLRNLQESCLPLYAGLHELGRETLQADHSHFPALVIQAAISDNTKRQCVHHVESWSSLCEAGTHFHLAKQLETAMLAWADDRHMNVDWFLDAVLMNLCGWRLDQEARKKPHWVYPGSMAAGQYHRTGIDLRRLHGWGTLDGVIPPPVVKPYNPSAQTRREHQQEFTLELDRYYTKQEEFFAISGFQKTTPKRARTVKDSPWLHFDWFVEYQMQERPAKEIAKKYTLHAIGEDAIYSALVDLARLLEVPLRPWVKRPSRQLKKKALNS